MPRQVMSNGSGAVTTTWAYADGYASSDMPDCRDTRDEQRDEADTENGEDGYGQHRGHGTEW